LQPLTQQALTQVSQQGMHSPRNLRLPTAAKQHSQQKSRRQQMLLLPSLQQTPLTLLQYQQQQKSRWLPHRCQTTAQQ
jgi:hypothetical protein